MPPRSKRRQSTRVNRNKMTSNIPAWLWLFTGLVVGSFAMFIVHLAQIRTDNSTEPGLADAEGNHPVERTNKDASENSKPLVFEFYDRFKNETVEVPKYDPPSTSSAQATHQYFLQVASFKHEEDADRARAKLILLNMTTNIEQTTLASGDMRFRVIVGPYGNKSKMAKARQTLVSNGFEFLTLKRPI